MKLNLLVENNGHTCGILRKKPDDNDWFRRNRNRCEACAKEYDRQLDAELSGVSEPAEVVNKPGDVQELTGGIGSTLSGKGKIIDILNAIRDMGGAKWKRSGQSKFGRRIRNKPKCMYGHTCDPLPVNVRYKDMFDSITGAPLPEYRDWYLKQQKCPVCRGDVAGCSNTISTEFGKPKPFCSEHIEHGSKYVKDLMDLNRRSDSEWEDLEEHTCQDVGKRNCAVCQLEKKKLAELHREYLDIGDKVNVDGYVGEIVHILDKAANDKIYEVLFDVYLNPFSKPAEKVLTFSPDQLELLDVNDESVKHKIDRRDFKKLQELSLI